MSQLFEAIMVICFGISWPLSILKSIRSKTAKGKSILFMSFILIGYCCGITSKLVSGTITYVFIFYVLNLILVSTDIMLYIHNTKLDKIRDAKLALAGCEDDDDLPLQTGHAT